MRSPKESQENQQSTSGGIRPLSYRRAFGIIIPLCLAALMLGGAVISIGNDVYAFVKPDMDATIEIPESTSAAELSRILQQNGIIENAFAFTIYLKSKGKTDAVAALSGEWTLNSNMSYREILAEIF